MFLASSVHDPEGGLIKMIERFGPHIPSDYEDAFVAVTPKTSRRTVEAIRASGIRVVRGSTSEGRTWGLVLAEGARRFPAFQLSDLDRLLHWMMSYPDEFRRFLQSKPRVDWLIMERTVRAHQTHHAPLYQTERIANEVISRAMGEKMYHDYFGGSIFVTRRAAMCVKNVRSRDWSILAEWPLTLKRAGFRLAYKVYEGLEWETPDRLPGGLTPAGRRTWQKKLDNPTEWHRRAVYAAAMIRGALKFL